ncbi:MAG: hypothetical protein QXE32_05945 [Sulfolobales archaeon]
MTRICYDEVGCDLYVDSECVNLDMISLARRSYGESYKMRVISEMPLGAGAGVSANIAIGLGFRIASKILGGENIRRILVSAGLIAHELEVRSMTGLGDVISELLGYGIEVRKIPGAPCYGSLESSSLKNFSVVVGILPRGIFTPEMLRRLTPEIIARARELIGRYEKNPEPEVFVEISHSFSKEIGFLSNEIDMLVKNSLKDRMSRGEVLGYFIKKSLLVILAERDIELNPEDLKDLKISKIVYLKPLNKDENIIRERDLDLWCSDSIEIYRKLTSRDLTSRRIIL